MNQPRKHRSAAVLALALALGWGALAVVALEASREDNALRSGRGHRKYVTVFLPQGWGFFTRDPREDDYDVLAFDGRHWRTRFGHPNFQWSLLLGWSRAARAQSVEFGLLSGSLDQDAWVDCTQSVDDCARDLDVQQTLRNASPRPTLCGEVIVMTRPPVPWAWARSAHAITMPSKLLKVDLQC